jgi:hypothetical protein
MSTSEPLTDEQLRAAYEAELKQIRVEQVVLEQVISLINFGMRRTGLQPGTEDEQDVAQVQVAIEAIRALMPLLEGIAPRQAAPIREALSQLQLAFVRLGGAAAAGPVAPDPAGAGTPHESAAPSAPAASPRAADPGGAPPAEPIKPGEPGPAERSGRLWIPGR